MIDLEKIRCAGFSKRAHAHTRTGEENKDETVVGDQAADDSLSMQWKEKSQSKNNNYLLLFKQIRSESVSPGDGAGF